jgi:protein-tyrosine-phosphatase
MAAAIYNKLTNSNNADSVGTYTGAPDEPEGQILENLFKTPHFFEIMEQNSMNVRKNSTKRLQPQMLNEYDFVISMAEEPYIPDFLKNDEKVIRWNIDNPTFVDEKIAKDTYEKIYILVNQLIIENKYIHGARNC